MKRWLLSISFFFCFTVSFSQSDKVVVENTANGAKILVNNKPLFINVQIPVKLTTQFRFKVTT
jgi:hypothetical protein